MSEFLSVLSIAAAIISVLAAIATIFIRFSSRRKRITVTKNIAMFTHQLFHKSSDLAIGFKEHANNPELVMLSVRREITKILSDAESMLTQINKKKCSLSLKIFSLENNLEEVEDIPIVTFARGFSDESREILDYKYYVNENTEFREILLNNKEYYYSPDLTHEYRYKNIHWQNARERGRYYRSLLVIPISVQRTKGEGRECLGFLSADSKENNAFKLDETLIILRSIGDAIYILLSSALDASEEVLINKKHKKG